MATLPKVIPINELKNTAKISELCRESDVPIIVTRNGYGEMVLMSVALYETTMTARPEIPPAARPEIPPAARTNEPPSREIREIRIPDDPAADDLTLLGQILGD